ncbi:MAG: outer membrane lipoprotein carrier protein LolA [Ginsengibacter sp.]
MKISLLTFFAISLFFSSNLIAQTKGMGRSDAAAKPILDGVSAKFKTYKSVTANFNLKIENVSGKLIGSKSGNVNMKGNKYRVSVTGQEIFFDGSTIWTYDKSSNEVQLTKFDPSSASVTPQKLFTNFYDKDFLYKLNDEPAPGSKFYEIELTPIDKTKPFSKVLLTVDKKTMNISNSKIFEKNGNRYTYSVTSIKTNTALPDDKFVFDAKLYPKVEVVDLR